MTTVALVPAFRRGDRVGETVAAVRPLVDDVVVIDDGSDDNGATAAAALAAGATVVTLAVNRGKGGALGAGVEATPDATAYLLIDADLAATAAGARPLLGALEDGADLAIGVLPSAEGRGGFGLVRDLARVGITSACGFGAAAPLSGQRAVRASLLRDLLPLADRFGVEVGMTIDAVDAGAAVVEVPITVDHLHRGRSLAGIRHRAAQGFDVARALWPRIARPRTRGIALGALAVLVLAALSVGSLRARVSGTAIGPAPRALLVAAPPGLTVADLRAPDLPALTALAGEGGAVAEAQVHGRSRDGRALWATVGAGERLAIRGADPRPPGDEPFLVTRRLAGAGRLADALHGTGRRVGFVGPSTTSPVRWAVADSQGHIDVASTAASLGPAGVANRALADLRAVDMVAVDASALGRDGFNELLSLLRGRLDASTLLVVMAPGPDTGPLQLTPLVVTGPGARSGGLTSAATRRHGFVVAADVAPTILGALGVPVPEGMTGRPMQRTEAAPSVHGLERLDRMSRLREQVWDPSIVVLVLVQVALYAWARWRRPAAGRGRRALLATCVGVAAWPMATWLVRLAPGADRLGPGAAALALAVDIAVSAIALRIGRRRGLAPLAAVLAAMLVLVVVDLGFGSALQASSAFGYTATSEGRFYGLGNASFALVATAACILIACAPRRAPWIPVFLGFVTLVIGLPTLGNDVGGLLTMAPVTVVAVALIWDRFSWRVAAGAGALGVLLVLAAGAYDLSRPIQERSHLGRFLIGGAWADVLQRRLEVNLHGYVRNPGFVPLVAMALALAVELRRGSWPASLPKGSLARIGLGAAVAAALIGHAVNDSGPVVVGIACITIGPFLVLRALAADEEQPPTVVPAPAEVPA